MTVPVPSPVAFRTPQQAHTTEPAPTLDLDRVVNLSFLTMMENPDLSCVYRVRSGDSARSIVSLALKNRLGREPFEHEIESYLVEVRELNGSKVDNLQPGEIFALPMDHDHALTHYLAEPEPVRPAPPTISHKIVDKPHVNADTTNVQSVVAPPGLAAIPGYCIVKDDGIIRSRIASPAELDDAHGTVTHKYQGELSSSFLGLFRSFFVASETRTLSGQLLSSNIEYDGFGASLKFKSVGGTLEFSLVRSIKTYYDAEAQLYKTEIIGADEMKHTLSSSVDGSRSWRS